jgi:hypothetical protein
MTPPYMTINDTNSSERNISCLLQHFKMSWLSDSRNYTLTYMCVKGSEVLMFKTQT